MERTMTTDAKKKTNALWSQYAINKDAAEQGVTITDLSLVGVSVTARWIKSDVVRAYQAKAMRKNRQAVLANQGVLPPALEDKLNIDTAANAIVVGWSGVTDEEGNELPFTPKNAIALFTALPEFMREIVQYASMNETYRAAALEDLVGNSEQP